MSICAEMTGAKQTALYTVVAAEMLALKPRMASCEGALG